MDGTAAVEVLRNEVSGMVPTGYNQPGSGLWRSKIY